MLIIGKGAVDSYQFQCRGVGRTYINRRVVITITTISRLFLFCMNPDVDGGMGGLDALGWGGFDLDNLWVVMGDWLNCPIVSTS